HDRAVRWRRPRLREGRPKNGAKPLVLVVAVAELGQTLRGAWFRQQSESFHQLLVLVERRLSLELLEQLLEAQRVPRASIDDVHDVLVCRRVVDDLAVEAQALDDRESPVRVLDRIKGEQRVDDAPLLRVEPAVGMDREGGHGSSKWKPGRCRWRRATRLLN